MKYLFLLILLVLSVTAHAVEQDPYRVLKVNPIMTLAEIRKIYRQKISKVHPDKCITLPESEQRRAHDHYIELSSAFQLIVKDKSQQIVFSATEFAFTFTSNFDNRYSYNAALLAGIQIQNIDHVKNAIAQGADCNALDSQGVSVLSHALDYPSSHNIEIVTLLIHHGADVNRPEDCLICKAVQRNDIKILNLLLESGAPIPIQSTKEISIFFLPITNNNHEMVKVLAHHGASLNVIDARGHTPLIYAIKFADNQMMTTLLEMGASANMPNKAGSSPLFAAIHKADLEKMKLLIDYGADVNEELPGGRLLDYDLKPEVAALLESKGAKKKFSWLNPKTWL